MTAKIIRDPLYNYVGIESDTDPWLLELLDTPEVQRLRRIHQLGVSHFTYPGADHSRLSHCLGVLHLMQQAIEHVGSKDPQARQAREALLAAALLHDVGHGPFSHLFEPCLGIDHEEWSCKILLNEETKIHKILRGVATHLPNTVAALVDRDNHEHPCWQKNLLSSQLDVDRLDYLRRDSLFTGAGYGHFDWYRILHTFEPFGPMNRDRDLVWNEKSKFAIEEYIFARYYMYWNVYLHKTTRGFEKLVEAMWKKARAMFDNGDKLDLVKPIAEFWKSPDPSVQQFLALEEFTVLSQIQIWTEHSDKSLSDLARRFLNRDRFASVDAPETKDPFPVDRQPWKNALLDLVKQHSEYDSPEMYCLEDILKSKYTQPYSPEPESDEQGDSNSIRLKLKNESSPVEISELLPRMRPLFKKSPDQYRYYIPKDLQMKAEKLRASFNTKA
jgi:hypothetical protein